MDFRSLGLVGGRDYGLAPRSSAAAAQARPLLGTVLGSGYAIEVFRERLGLLDVALGAMMARPLVGVSAIQGFVVAAGP